MIEGQPSRTARRVAMRRAAHQVIDRPVVFEDPLAIRILGHDGDDSALTSGAWTTASKRLRAFLVARSRMAEDELAAAAARGTEQYVVLGAGLDTFAYRNPYPKLRVFEVDFPATQEWKRTRLAAAGIRAPESMTFAPVDFARETLADGLAHAGFKAQEPAFFSWLGVTPYLQRPTVLETLRWVINSFPTNGIVFDYTVPRGSLNFLNRLAFDALARRVEAAGEPFVGFFDPQELMGELREMRYHHVQDFNSETINARYFRGRADGLKVGGDMGHIMAARG